MMWHGGAVHKGSKAGRGGDVVTRETRSDHHSTKATMQHCEAWTRRCRCQARLSTKHNQSNDTSTHSRPRHAPMLPGCHVPKHPCCHVPRLPCCHVAVHPCCHAPKHPCCHVPMLPRCHASLWPCGRAEVMHVMPGRMHWNTQSCPCAVTHPAMRCCVVALL